MKYISLCILVASITHSTFAQESGGYIIPFAPTGNTIELSVENTSQAKSSNISVEIKGYPSWITFASQRVSIPELPKKSALSALLPADGRVRLKIYNMLGQEVFTVVDADRPAGFHQEV